MKSKAPLLAKNARNGAPSLFRGIPCEWEIWATLALWKQENFLMRDQLPRSPALAGVLTQCATKCKVHQGLISDFVISY